MTASYAMRNSPKISAPTRKRVQAAAAKLGYVPNPEIGRLMHLLRAKRIYAYQASIAIPAITFGTRGAMPPYTAAVVGGAISRAAELGYSVDELAVDLSKVDAERFGQILSNRGIQGVLLPPMPRVLDCSQILDWSRVSVVAATNSALHLNVHRVIPHHFANFSLVLDTLIERNYRRPGLVTEADHLERTGPGYWAALALAAHRGLIQNIPSLNFGGNVTTQAWFRKYRPDVLITAMHLIPHLSAELGYSFPGKLGLLVLDHPGHGPIAGIDEQPKTIGKIAAEQLIAQIQRGERGLMSIPHHTMVDGAWIDGATLRKI